MTIDRSKIEDVVRKVQNLRRLTQTTGFITGRSQRELLETLNAEELAHASELLLHQI